MLNPADSPFVKYCVLVSSGNSYLGLTDRVRVEKLKGGDSLWIIPLPAKGMKDSDVFDSPNDRGRIKINISIAA